MSLFSGFRLRLSCKKTITVMTHVLFLLMLVSFAPRVSHMLVEGFGKPAKLGSRPSQDGGCCKSGRVLKG